MAEVQYTAVVETAPKYTVTREATGSVLTGSVLFTFQAHLKQARIIEAFRALRSVINRDALHASDPADYPTTGSLVR